MIVDAQVHIWAADRPGRRWIPGGAEYAHRAPPLEADGLLAEMDRVGVGRALLVSPTWEGDRNDVVLAATESHPDRFGAIVRFDLRDRANAANVEAWSEDPRVYGARAVFARQSADWLRDGTADWLWPLAEDFGLPMMVFAPGQYEGVASVARRHPNLKLTLCHLGLATTLRGDEIVPHVDSLLRLADIPNIAVKASCLPSYSVEPYPFPFLQAQIERVVDAFGVKRVFWGSDLSRLRCDYADLYRFFVEELKYLDEIDREWIMGRGICEWFDWPAA